MSPGPTRHVVSFVFCDQVGSTALLERIGEAANDELRRDLFAALRRPIDAFGGIEVKSQGDGVMVAFSTGPSDAVSCALAMHRAAEGLAGGDHGSEVQLRAGVATGEVTAEDHDYFGRPVVEAARLCAAAQPGEVLATEAVAALVDADLAERAHPVGGLMLKGLADPLPCVRFEWTSTVTAADRAIPTPPLLDPTGLLPFIGREQELAVIDEAWDRADLGAPAIVTVTGPAGTGKSRLVAEATRRRAGGGTGGHRPRVALAGSGRNEPLVDALRWWARSTPPTEVRDTLGPLCAVVSERIPAVAIQLSSLPDAVDGAVVDRCDEPLDPVVAGLVAVAAANPLLLLIDDAELISTAVADDLTSLIESAPNGLLLVIAARDAHDEAPLRDVLSKVDGADHARHVELLPWNAAETERALLGAAFGFDRATALALHDAADGNPARVTELAAGARSGRSVADVVASVQPFKGLVPYGASDGEVFFGRDDDVAGLLARLATTRLLTVTGPSGAGKSSIVLAGVLPALARGALPGSEAWPQVVVEADRDDIHAVQRGLDSLPATGPGVLVVDQAEELLPTTAADARSGIIDLLLERVADPGGSVRVILALRGDRYGDLTVHSGLAAAVERNHVLVGPLRPDQLADVVTGPAVQAGLRVETGLAELISVEAAAEPGALPLVSHALRETWRRRRGSTLTIADYREAGGVRGAIASTADELVLALDANGQRLVRSLFIELAELTRTGEPVRRRLSIDTTPDVLGATRAEVDDVLGPAIDARLVVSDGTHVQIAHEALLREWPRLRRWIEEDREEIRRRRAIAEQAAEWDVAGRRSSDLLQGGRLELACDDLEAGAGGWTALARDYVDESVRSREAALAAERQLLVAQRRANRRLRVLLGSTAALLAVALVAGTLAVNARGDAVAEADRARVEQARADQQAAAADVAAAEAAASARTATAAAAAADARRLAGQSAAFVTDPQLQLLTAVEAVRVEPLPAVEAQLLGSLAQRSATIRLFSGPLPLPDFTSSQQLALLDDGRAASLSNGEVTTWDTAAAGTPEFTQWPELGVVTSIVGGANGFLVAAGSTLVGLTADGVSDGRIAFDDDVLRLAAAPSGALAAAVVGGDSAQVALVDLTSPRGPAIVRTVAVATPPTGMSASAVGVDDDGRIALLSGSTLFEWDASGLALPPTDVKGVGFGVALLGGEPVQLSGGSVVPVADLVQFEPTDVSSTVIDATGAPIEVSSGGPLALPIDFDFPGSDIVTSRSPGGGERVAAVSGSQIVWSDRVDGAIEPGWLDPGLGQLWDVALATDGRTALVTGDTATALVALDGTTSLDRSRFPLADATTTAFVTPSVSPDGSHVTLLSGGLDDMTSQVVELVTGTPVGPPVDGRAGFLDDRTVVSGAVEADGLRLRSIDFTTGAPTGDETLIPGFRPSDVAAEHAPSGRIVITGFFGDDSADLPVLVGRGEPSEWRVLDEIDGFGALALRPNSDEAWAVREGELARIDLTQRTVDEIPVAGGELEQLAFSGDGATLFLSSGNRVLSLDLSGVEPVAPTLLAALTIDVAELTADATGARVVARDTTGQAVLLDSATGDAYIFGPDSAQQVAFLPNDDLLVIDESTVRVVGLDTDRLVATACRVAGRLQTPGEWIRYGPQDAPFEPACADEGRAS